jgi:hypothetical protein
VIKEEKNQIQLSNSISTFLNWRVLHGVPILFLFFSKVNRRFYPNPNVSYRIVSLLVWLVVARSILNISIRLGFLHSSTHRRIEEISYSVIQPDWNGRNWNGREVRKDIYGLLRAVVLCSIHFRGLVGLPFFLFSFLRSFVSFPHNTSKWEFTWASTLSLSRPSQLSSPTTTRKATRIVGSLNWKKKRFVYLFSQSVFL